jgi:hypothetical protein
MREEGGWIVAISFKTLVAAGIVAIVAGAGAGPARAQQFVPPNGNLGPFPPPVVCRHVGPCHCPWPRYPVYGYGYGYGYGWGYRPVARPIVVRPLVPASVFVPHGGYVVRR